MVIITLEKVPAALRGELSRWLIEVKSGVYVGHVSAMVRERLWEKCSANRKAGCVFQAWSTNNEQHFSMRLAGENVRQVVDWEGLLLVEESKEVLNEVQKKRTRRG
jgi:CRISPR-associated protein Cas2